MNFKLQIFHLMYGLTQMPFCITGKDDSGQRMEALEIPDKHFYVAVQFHPEYLSRPLRPSPPYVGLLAAASGQLEQFVSQYSRTRSSVRKSNSNNDVKKSPVVPEKEFREVALEDPELELGSPCA